MDWMQEWLKLNQEAYIDAFKAQTGLWTKILAESGIHFTPSKKGTETKDHE
jgi:hypothetical protein